MILEPGKETILVMSDGQEPFGHKDALAFYVWIAERWNPTKIVNVGDEIDNHCLSRYFKNPDGYSAGYELKHAVAALKPFYKEFPNVHVCTSNHTERPYDRAFEAGIPRSFLKEINEVLEAPPGWKWADKWVIDGVAYVHGHKEIPGGKNAIRTAAEQYPRSVVFGHMHSSAGVEFHATSETLRFAMCVGCMIDHKAYAFTYGSKCLHKPILGCGIVYKNIPIFIPMILDKNGRWIRSATLEFIKAKEEHIFCTHTIIHKRGNYKTKDGVTHPVYRCKQCNKVVHSEAANEQTIVQVERMDIRQAG
jgi:hypothetical protein